MYVNGFFSNPNTIVDLTARNIVSYYLELWIMFDSINTPTLGASNLAYFFAPPHQILQDKTDGKYKYANMNVGAWTTFYQLPSISQYEWNRIIIMNYANPNTSTW